MTDANNVVTMFLVEGRELLAEFEAGLLTLEDTLDEPEMALIHSMFRAAHTIKGSAGIVGVDSLMRFTHHVESLMDMVRDEDLAITADVTALLLTCCDHMRVLLDLAEAGDMDAPSVQAEGDELVAQLNAAMTGEASPAPTPAANPVAACAPADATAWTVFMVFGPDCLRDGFDPASALYFLGQQATMGRVVPLVNRLPLLNLLNAESCYIALAFEVSGVDAHGIEEAFGFFGEDTLRVMVPAGATSAQRVALLDALHDRLKDDEARPWIDAGLLTADEWAGVAQADPLLTNTPTAPAPTVPAARPVPDLPMGLVTPQTVAEAKGAKPPVDPPSKADKETPKTHAASAHKFVKVPAERLDDLINQVGEVVIAMAGVELQARQSHDSRMIEAVTALTAMLENVQSGALQLRMVPIGETFSRFHRLVRDLAKDLGKDVQLVVEGGDTELDKSMVERISDPLMHLVRNSMDHGIETTEERAQTGKPGSATLTLKAHHEGSSVVVEVSDDGRGLNRERIRAKAVERGLIDESAELSDAEIDQLIFAPGFSTAAAVTNLSGRGVGMDVVRSSIESLRGAITLESNPGKGTRFLMRLPLTLAIIDGFMVGVGDARLIVPLDSVVECIEMPPNALNPDEPQYLNLRGEALPYVNLRRFFDMDGDYPRRPSVVVVRFGAIKAGILVDALYGEIQTVIKPLGRIFQHLRAISGTSILGSGEIAMVLDMHQLLQLAIDRSTQQMARRVNA